jgi:O-6-methylguanine DNA methyltransferase
MKRLVEQLDCYFNGEAVVFTAPLDLSGTTPFQRRVWDELTSIPYGKTRSYSEVAAAVGNRAAARAVGAANRSNPIPIVIPCHRVIKADGTLGGYSSGIAIKEQLLRLEAAR